jgi:hypothetical protein
MQINGFLASLSGDLHPISETAARLGTESNSMTDDAIAVSHRPHVAPQSYAMWMFKPLSVEVLDRYQRIHGVVLSEHYLPILCKLNGAHIFEFSLFGVPPSMVSDMPLLNRSTTQPYDVGTANSDWKREYSVPADWFHFGGGPLSFDENIGYFFDPVGTIYSVRKNGERLRSWQSFSEFLEDELRKAEAAYPAYEEFMTKIIANSKKAKPWWRKIFQSSPTKQR